MGGDEGSFQRDEGLVGVDFDESREEIDTGYEKTVPYYIVGGELRDGSLKAGNTFLPKACG